MVAGSVIVPALTNRIESKSTYFSPEREEIEMKCIDGMTEVISPLHTVSAKCISVRLSMYTIEQSELLSQIGLKNDTATRKRACEKLCEQKKKRITAQLFTELSVVEKGIKNNSFPRIHKHRRIKISTKKKTS